MAEYTHPKQSLDRDSNAGAENFEFDISSAITAANIPPYSKIEKVTITVWGDIDTPNSRGKMTASFGSESICSDVWCGGSAGEVSRSKDLTVSTFFNSENANAGDLKDSSTRLKITLDGPVMISKFKHTASWQLYIQWTTPTYYTVTWENHDGTELQTDTGVLSGTKPTYNGPTPTKASTAQYTYTFSGWSPPVGAISGDTTYIAQFTATTRSYTLNVTAGTGGTVSGGGTYEYGKTVTLTATPNIGYKFVKWSDGNTSASRTVTVSGNATYTATFEKLTYDIGYDNIFSLSGTAYSGSAKLGGGANGNITFDLNAGTVTIESVSRKTNNECYTSYGSDGFTMNVQPETNYIFTADVDFADNSTSMYGQMFIFCYDANGAAVNGPTDLSNNNVATSQHIGIYIRSEGTHSIKFKTPANCYKLRVRMGSTDIGVITTYSNIGVYKLDNYDAYIKSYPKVREPYKYGDAISLMTPTRTGHTFLGWYDTNGNKITSTTGLDANTIVYAQWRINKYDIVGKASPVGGGTVSGGGSYDYSKTATLTATPATGYKFKYWQDNTSLTNATRTVTVTGNATYTAVFEKLTYTVTFKDDNGATLKTETVAYGGKPTPPTAPVKPNTAQHKYTFDGWYDSNGNKWTSSTTITGTTTFTARYTSTVQKYTVRWYNYDDTLLETDTDVPYGTKPTYNGETPTKPSDEYYNYGFAGWSPSTDEAIQGDKNFTAQFAQTDRYYTVRWLNASAEEGVEGELLETDEVLFNTQPDYNGTTPKHPKQDTDPEFEYTFIGWAVNVNDPAKPDTELEKVKGNITYTAIYEKTKKLYAITVILFDAQYTEVYEYGTEITIEAPETVDFHRFVKWSDGNTQNSRKITVIGVATYQATYERIPVPVKVNLEQAKEVYIVPITQTIVYVIDGTIPTVEIDEFEMDTVNGWNFVVSNSIPNNGYALQKLFITDKSGVTTRIY